MVFLIGIGVTGLVLGLLGAHGLVTGRCESEGVAAIALGLFSVIVAVVMVGGTWHRDEARSEALESLRSAVDTLPSDPWDPEAAAEQVHRSMADVHLPGWWLHTTIDEDHNLVVTVTGGAVDKRACLVAAVNGSRRAVIDNSGGPSVSVPFVPDGPEQWCFIGPAVQAIQPTTTTTSTPGSRAQPLG